MNGGIASPLRAIFSLTHTLFSAVLIMALTACSSFLPRSEVELAATIAAPARLEEHQIVAGAFTLALRQRDDAPGQDLIVYIEGDGYAWESRRRPSVDPTPSDPVALRLATLDTAPNVVWIARPCQYVQTKACRPIYWTNGRFAPEIVAAMDAAIDAAKARVNASRVHLVGYSGGGGIAVLVAAHREDVASLRTVAGNLDHAAFTRHHRVSPMSASLNPADVAPKLARLPQRHWVGSDDDVILPAFVGGFLSRMGDTRCAGIETVRGAHHAYGWASPWAERGQMIPTCGTQQ